MVASELFQAWYSVSIEIDVVRGAADLGDPLSLFSLISEPISTLQ
jgi:hypothetical protein